MRFSLSVSAALRGPFSAGWADCDDVIVRSSAACCNFELQQAGLGETASAP